MFRSCHSSGHVAPMFLGLVSPQTELQEVLGADEEAGSPDDDETATLGSSEEDKGQENTEPPGKTALLTASVPAATQVDPGGSRVPLVTLHVQD